MLLVPSVLSSQFFSADLAELILFHSFKREVHCCVDLVHCSSIHSFLPAAASQATRHLVRCYLLRLPDYCGKSEHVHRE